MSNDPYTLNRFLEAQEKSYQRAISELQEGKKQSHWMWFIFPQFLGLGKSPTAILYAIKSIDEAKAYLNHFKLGSRLQECTQTLLKISKNSAYDIFGHPDHLKFCSSMTLFDYISPDKEIFCEALEKYFDGRKDKYTLNILNNIKT